MDSTTLWFGGAIAGISALLATLRQYVFLAWAYVRGLIIVEATYADWVLVLRYLVDHAWMPDPGSAKRFSSRFIYTQRRNAREQVPFLEFNMTMRFAVWRKRLLILRFNEAGIQVQGLRGAFEPKKLAELSCEYENQRWELYLQGKERPDKFRVERMYGRFHLNMKRDDNLSPTNVQKSPNGADYSQDKLDRNEFSVPIGIRTDQIGPPRKTRDMMLRRLALSPEARRVARAVTRWVDDSRWYLDRGIPWRLGVGAYGPPGNGKTAFFAALAESLGIPIILPDLASMANQDLAEVWARARELAPCIVLLEDLDGIFHGREPVDKEHTRITFDGLLQAIDGVERNHGVITAITTNKPDSLDEALAGCGQATRPGRIDYMVEFPQPDEEGYRLIANKILFDRQELVEEVVSRAVGQDMSGAQCERLCIDMAKDFAYARLFADAEDDSNMEASTL